jgi:hypothetical protein
MDIKNIIIFLVVFFLIMWLQHNDDKKFSKIDKRITLYDKIKIPLVSALFVILVKELNLNDCTKFIQSIMVVKSPVLNRQENFNNEFINLTNPLDDIFIDPPDF